MQLELLHPLRGQSNLKLFNQSLPGLLRLFFQKNKYATTSKTDLTNLDHKRSI